MARNHFRFVVRDAYGYAIQNAQVNIYQPDTTTAFTGTAYDAASGGAAVTNPFTTNDQGEIEAWFDTAQEVDVQVDDNSDAAYRAVEGSAQTLPFTTFTESATIDDAPANVQAHGPSYHTDRTRSIFLPVNDGAVLGGGTLSSLGTAPDEIRTISLPDASDTGATWALALPDWASGGIDVTIYFAGAVTAGGNVRWNITAKEVNEGDDVTAAGTTVSYDSAEPTTANLLVVDATQADVITPTVAGELIMIGVIRDGDHANDDYAQATHLIGIRVDYTATQ
jgi:hypothetical protein